MTELEEKLQNRLNKAIEVFKQKENEINELKTQINELNNILQEKIETINDQNNTIKSLREKIDFLEPIVNQYNKKIIDENNKKIQEIESSIERKEYKIPVKQNINHNGLNNFLISM